LKGRDYAEDMATAMRRNPQLKLFIGTGYYDLATTLGAAEYTVSHAGFDAQRVRMAYYASGHMPYLGADSRRELGQDLRLFIGEVSTPGVAAAPPGHIDTAARLPSSPRR
jgi:carboxypeptidase C (cathepsin A)